MSTVNAGAEFPVMEIWSNKILRCHNDLTYGGPRPRITAAIRRCRKSFRQWQHSSQWRLRSHWPKFLRQRHIAVIIQGHVKTYCVKNLNRHFIRCRRFACFAPDLNWCWCFFIRTVKNLGTNVQTAMALESKYTNFLLKIYISKHLRNLGHFVQASMNWCPEFYKISE